MNFPVWQYHRAEGARLVTNALELEQLGADWHDSPKKAATAPPAEAPATAPAEVVEIPVVIEIPKPRRMTREELDAAEAADFAEYQADQEKKTRKGRKKQ